MHEPIVPMIFPVLGVHVSGAKFMYPDLIWKELCDKKGNLPSNSCVVAVVTTSEIVTKKGNLPSNSCLFEMS